MRFIAHIVIIAVQKNGVLNLIDSLRPGIKISSSFLASEMTTGGVIQVLQTQPFRLFSRLYHHRSEGCQETVILHRSGVESAATQLRECF